MNFLERLKQLGYTVKLYHNDDFWFLVTESPERIKVNTYGENINACCSNFIDKLKEIKGEAK